MSIKVEMSLREAAAVRQVLFESQKNYTYNIVCVPERIVEIREVITNIDDAISQEVENETADS